MQSAQVKRVAPLPFEPLVSLWRHRELYRRILTRDIQSAFRGSVLGLAWVVVIPLVLVAIYTFVFGVVLGSSWPTPTGSRYEAPLIYFAGIMVFSFFMEIISRAPNHIRENRTYVTKVIFPVDILCWVLAGTALFKFCVNLALLLVFIVMVSGAFPLKALLLPLLLAPFALMTVGIAFILASVGAFIRDLTHALQALAPIILFVSPVFYPIEQVPEPFRFLYWLNPLGFVLEGARGLLFFDRGIPPWPYLAYWLAAIAVFSLGYAFFRRLRPGFADVV